MEFYPARHEQSGLSAACLEDGSIAIRRGAEVLSTLRLFVDGFRARYSEWLVEPRLEFSPDGAWLAISYGMGYVYLAEPQTGRVVREFRLFDDVRYEDGSFQDIDTYCYYNEHTRLDFSPSGRWLAVRSLSSTWTGGNWPSPTSSTTSAPAMRIWPCWPSTRRRSCWRWGRQGGGSACCPCRRAG